MGETYEQFTHINLKRQQGQFFTNRLVIEMMVKILDPDIGEHALDPAGGSGGFATSIFRYLRRKVIANTTPNSPVRDRQLATIKDSVYLVEIAARLVKIAKCAMLLTGDGQSGMTRGNSLDLYSNFDPWIVSRCAKGKSNAPSVIATNPPFSGQKVESQISDKTILKNFVFGHSYKKADDGSYYFSGSDTDILQHQAPELLFLERCIDWLKPGGRLGIVLPKGILDNVSYEAYRQWLLERCEIAGVVTLHKDTFQPDTGVRTCILFINKPKEGEKPRDDYEIFMAMSQRIGQDSKGNSVYILDANGNSTGELNHDLNDIANAFIDFKNGQEHQQSEYIFSIRRSDLKDHININPQHYSPKLNAALDAVLEYDNKDGWATTTVGQLEAGIRIYIGPRWNSTSIKIDNPADTTNLVPYLTANAALELRRFTIKWLDPSRANATQKKCMDMLRIQEGDILVSRSGTIGKVTYATKDLANNYVVSDDLVRIRVQNPDLRAYATAKMTQMIEEHRYSKSRGNLYKVRDVFVKGREMGQLLDLSYCQREDDCYTFLNNPQEFKGILAEAHSGYAMIETYSPSALSGEFVKVSIGRRTDNSLSEQQIGHHIHFYAGLSLEAITALSKSAKDYSSDEKLDLALLQNEGRPNQANSRSESARNHQPAVARNETSVHTAITPARAPQNDTAEIIVDNPVVSSVQKTEILKNGLVVSLLPQKKTENGYLGIFVLDGAQYKGQINLEKMKQKKKAKSLYKQLDDALGKNLAVQGFRIIGEPKDGVYPLHADCHRKRPAGP